MTKKISLIMVFVLCITLLTACGSGGDGVKKEEETQKESAFLNLGPEFVIMKDAVVAEPFDEVGDNYDGRTYVADDVLYKDEKGNLAVEFRGYDTYIFLYGRHYKTSIESPLAINIVDLDKNDDYRELAIWSEGPSGDPGADFFRFDGSKVVPLTFYNEEYDYESSKIYGYFDADEDDVGPTYGAMWTDGEGRVVTPFQIAGFIEKRVALSCFELDGNQWRVKELDVPELIGEHTVSQDFSAFYTQSDDCPSDLGDSIYFRNFDPQYAKEFKKGEKIEIIDYAPIYSYYMFYVEYQGERGVIAFWLGD